MRAITILTFVVLSLCMASGMSHAEESQPEAVKPAPSFEDPLPQPPKPQVDLAPPVVVSPPLVVKVEAPAPPAQVVAPPTPLVPIKIVVDTPKPEGPHLYFGLAVQYSGANSGSSPNVNVTSGATSTSVSQTVDTSTSFTAAAEVGLIQAHGFGFNIGFAYDLPRTEKGATANAAFLTATEGPSSATITLQNVYLNAVYSVDRTYFYLGGNYSIPDINVPPEQGLVTVKGKVGAQLGGGYMITPNLAAEIGLRRINIGIDGTAGNVESSGQTTFDGLQVGLKFMF